MNSVDDIQNLIKKLWNPRDPALLIYRHPSGMHVTKDRGDLSLSLDSYTCITKQNSLYIRDDSEVYGCIGGYWDNTLDAWYLGTEVIETNQPDEIKIALLTPRIIELLGKYHDGS